MRAANEGGFGSMQPTCDADVVRRFVAAFAIAAAQTAADAMSELCAATCALALMLREQGCTPERAVVSMKEWLTPHDGRGWSPSLDVTDAAVRTESLVYACMLPWFVSAYYGDFTTACGCRVSPDLSHLTLQASWPHAGG